MATIGFDNNKYLHLQSEHIRKRIAQFGGKLYLEFGGKLFDDFHASRVLPGFEPDSKLKMLMQIKERVEFMIAINSSDIEKNKQRSDLGITYDVEVIRLINAFRSIGFYVGSVVLTRFNHQPSAIAFQKRIELMGVKVYHHYNIDGYPSDISKIVSDDGYGKNDYVETTKELIVVTAPGPGSGKMATCLSQLYHEHKRGIGSGYAKFETFPIWNLPITHPVNLAYEAATADLNDVNMIDPFHLEAYGETTVNYNRDVEIFPVVRDMLNKILGKCPYKSPTDMGVNMAGNCIIDEDIVKNASRQEIIRRYYHTLCDQKKGEDVTDALLTLELLMKKAGIKPIDRAVISPALKKEKETQKPAAALCLPDKTIITGKTSPLLGASAAVLLNALKALAGIDDKVELISPHIIEPIQKLKTENFGNKNPRLHTDEVLIALSICATSDENARIALNQLGKLKGCDIHSTVILSSVDVKVFKRLGLNLTCEPVYQEKSKNEFI